MKRTTALIPGSFDPVTLGHEDVIARAAQIFDRVYVTVFVNTEKHGGYFTPQERLEMVRAACRPYDNVSAELYGGLVADFMHEHGISTLVKGVRGVCDFDYESGLASIMRAFDPEFETVLLPARAQFAHISSTYARELIKYGRSLEAALSAPVAALAESFGRRRA